MQATIRIVEEPTGDTYRGLLRFAAAVGSLFSLVWREQFRFDESALGIRRRLEGELVSESWTDEWPGTRLLGHMATVRKYRLSASSLAVISEARGLYSWLEPVLPEDLAFYEPDGHVWLGSIAHERDAFVDPAAVDVEDLITRVPGLRLEARDAG